MPETGSFLGDLKDELDEGNHIVEYSSGGAKNYVYKMKHHTGHFRTKTVIKGISMVSSNSKIACFDNVVKKVEEYVKNYDTSATVFYDTDSHFHRDVGFRIFMTNLKKNYRIEYDKRVICTDFTTIPYGYKPLTSWCKTLRGSGPTDSHWKKSLRQRYLKI